MTGLCRLAAIFVSFALFAGTAAPPAQANGSNEVSYAWVELAPPNVGIVRALTPASACPDVDFDGDVVRMSERAAPDGDFAVRTCEAKVPDGTRRIVVAGRRLPVPPSDPRRIVVVGDSGCRMKAGAALDDGFQSCNDPGDWEFAKVARQVAASHPDLIIHVGDYVYREEPCTGNAGCKGSPYDAPGMRWQTWQADFFAPARPMLAAAPIVFVRGDHEQCERAGAGWFRFLYPLQQSQCTDFTEPYAIDAAGLRLVVMDTVQAVDTSLSPQVVLDRYGADFRRAARLATGSTWLVSHRPIWGIRPKSADGSQNDVINVTVERALRNALGTLPPAVQLVLTGHIHLAEALSFGSGRPPQLVAGIGGTKLLPRVTAPIVGTSLDGAPVTAMTTLAIHGFMTFEPRTSGGWSLSIRNAAGSEVAGCTLAAKSLRCSPD